MPIAHWMFVRIFPFTLLLAGVILVNYQPPSLEWVELLHLDECEPPCWIGITPGRTTVSEAKARAGRPEPRQRKLKTLEAKAYETLGLGASASANDIQIVHY